MGRKEKGEEREEQGEKRKEGLLIARKLRRSVLAGKRGGNCTTPPPKWRLGDKSYSENSNKPFTEFLSRDTSPTVSARKLCANLWDTESHKNPVVKMVKGGPRARRRPQKSNGFNGNSKSNDQDELASASSFGRAALASLVQYPGSVERKDDRTIQPVSPASYGSSAMEVAPYRHSLGAASSQDLKFRMVGSSFGHTTSTELIKVLNRIWSLEEQNALNVSLVRALKMEIDHSRARVKKLLMEKESDRQEIDELAKQVADDKLFRKSVNQDHIRAAVQSVLDELEDERKLRKRSEALHRKLVREISELKSSFANALRELERERKARMLLENLCDEFAKGISDYEHEVRAMKHKSEKERSTVDQPDRLILHISEAWLDERMQMKLAEAETNTAEKTTIVDKLGFDIATFLQAKQSAESKSRRFSMESFPLNEAASAPRVPAGEEDYTDGDSHYLEADKRDHQEELLTNSNSVGKGAIRSQKSMTRALPCRGNKNDFVEKEEPEKSDRQRLVSEDLGKQLEINLVRNGSSSMEGGHLKVHSESCIGEESHVKSLLGNSSSSPVQPWNSKLMTPDFEESERSLRWPRDLDENTLMAQLIEARLERRRRSSCHKPSKGSI